jgi:hypothetical protein
LRDAGYLYFTGYMWDTEVQKGAIQRAISICRQAGITVVFDLADPFAVDRYHEGCGEGLGGGGIPRMHGYGTFLPAVWCFGVGGGFPLASSPLCGYSATPSGHELLARLIAVLVGPDRN